MNNNPMIALSSLKYNVLSILKSSSKEVDKISFAQNLIDEYGQKELKEIFTEVSQSLRQDDKDFFLYLYKNKLIDIDKTFEYTLNQSKFSQHLAQDLMNYEIKDISFSVFIHFISNKKELSQHWDDDMIERFENYLISNIQLKDNDKWDFKYRNNDFMEEINDGIRKIISRPNHPDINKETIEEYYRVFWAHKSYKQEKDNAKFEQDKIDLYYLFMKKASLIENYSIYEMAKSKKFRLKDLNHFFAKHSDVAASFCSMLRYHNYAQKSKSDIDENLNLAMAWAEDKFLQCKKEIEGKKITCNDFVALYTTTLTVEKNSHYEIKNNLVHKLLALQIVDIKSFLQEFVSFGQSSISNIRDKQNKEKVLTAIFDNLLSNKQEIPKFYKFLIKDSIKENYAIIDAFFDKQNLSSSIEMPKELMTKKLKI